EEIAQALLSVIKEAKKIYTTEEIISLIFELEKYSEHKEKIMTTNGIDISRVLGSDLFEEDKKIVNENKTLYSILKAAKHVEQNKFGHWGVHNWREIKPKTINDKIYLILKHQGKPLHFAGIADMINKIVFDNKKANAATVHNELILDSKYVLVGRGLYGLKEWGYKKGTVADVIKSILNEIDEPITRNEIIEKVLEKRLVKKATIILALMNKDKFKKEEGKYILV
ncbi:winged helix-turn-helix domain-containing protein, partial [bacterium]|nr:winged helix-turn-helix domain-containing protein [bacterium]